jgi:hypothetical protein
MLIPVAGWFLDLKNAVQFPEFIRGVLLRRAYKKSSSNLLFIKVIIFMVCSPKKQVLALDLSYSQGKI